MAMVHRLIKEGWPLDIVLFYDGGMEFKALYEVIAKVEKLCEKKGIRFVTLQPALPFEYKAFEMPVCAKNGECKCGYSWCGGPCRWATFDKLEAISKFYDELEENSFIVEYVGIAADEKERAMSKRLLRNNGKVKLYPLIEWNMTEAECLQYCYAEGFVWMENGYRLYDLLKRVSCWCCRNKNLKELRNIFQYLPEYWENLKQLQKRTSMPFYKGMYTIEDLENHFRVEGIGWDLFDFAQEKGYDEFTIK